MTRYVRCPRVFVVALVVLGSAAPAAAITEDEFQLRSGADVVALCAMVGNAGMGAAIGAGVGLLGDLSDDQNQQACEQDRRDAQAGR